MSDFEKDTDDWVMEEANWERFRIELRTNHSVYIIIKDRSANCKSESPRITEKLLKTGNGDNKFKICT